VGATVGGKVGIGVGATVSNSIFAKLPRDERRQISNKTRYRERKGQGLMVQSNQFR